MEKPKMSVENAFNLIVGLTRQVKLNWEEHKAVEEAINIVLTELNKVEKEDASQE